MPTPKRVIAVGACAVSGGVFAGSFVCAKGLAGVLPVDVEVPGHPPPPLAILHGLLVAVGRKNSASPVSSGASGKRIRRLHDGNANADLHFLSLCGVGILLSLSGARVAAGKCAGVAGLSRGDCLGSGGCKCDCWVAAHSANRSGRCRD